MSLDEEYQFISSVFTGFDELCADSKAAIYTLTEKISVKDQTDEETEVFRKATDAIIDMELTKNGGKSCNATFPTRLE